MRIIDFMMIQAVAAMILYEIVRWTVKDDFDGFMKRIFGDEEYG